MVRTAALFLILSAGTLCARSPDREFSASHWVAICEPSPDAKLVAAGQTPNDFQSGKCWGAFQAMQVLAGAMVDGKAALGIWVLVAPVAYALELTVHRINPVRFVPPQRIEPGVLDGEFVS
jgi:hypothetical protein